MISASGRKPGAVSSKRASSVSKVQWSPSWEYSASNMSKRSSPLWGTLIGLTRREKPLFGLLAQPVLEEVFFGGPSGSWLNKAERRDRLKSRGCKTLAKAMLGSTHPDMFAGDRAPKFRALSAKCLLTRFGGDCYNYAMVAAGYLDLVVESQLKPYDIVPLIPIITGAGGTVTDWAGKSAASGGRVVATGDPRLHDQVLSRLAAG